VEEFHAIRSLLEELGYLSGWMLKPRGERLRRIYNETDLLLTEAVERGYLMELEPAELAALASVFVYEPRNDTPSVGEWPTEKLEERWVGIDQLWSDLTALESRHRLSPTRRPDPGFALMAHRWASGDGFDELPAAGLAPGDFVRVSRQLADLLRQLKEAAPELAQEADLALRAVDRGVVAAQGVGG
jgi:ATP-dependent RNA helicase HelY